MRDTLLPRLRATAHRLEIARHQTLIDDRLDGTPASLRFRLTPWAGPFDEQGPAPGAVLELVQEEDELEARIWLDALAEHPSERRAVPLSGAAGGWVDRLLLDFVERVLRRS